MSILNNRLFRATALLVPVLLAACAQTVDVEYANRGETFQGTIYDLDHQFQVNHFATVHFGFDMDTLDADAIERLQAQAGWINAFPDVRFTVTGHTDLVGNEDYNMDLGLRRANAVLEHLVILGVDRDRLLAMVSAGEERPIDDVDTPQRLSRRVLTAVLLPDQASAPPVTQSDNPDPVPTGDPEAPFDPPADPEDPVDPPANPEDAVDPPSGKRPNSGRGNGDEAGDPGNSEGNNNGGDEADGDWKNPGQGKPNTD